jgi:hypothetical protein
MKEGAGSEVVLSAIQTYAAYHLAYYDRSYHPEHAHQRRLQTIALINQSLADTGTMLDDSTVSAVGLTVSLDMELSLPKHRKDFKREMLVHSKGYLWLVTLRGGAPGLAQWLEKNHYWRDLLSGGELTVAIEEYNTVGHSYAACLRRDLVGPESIIRTDRDVVDDLAPERFRALLDLVCFLYTRAYVAAQHRQEHAASHQKTPQTSSTETGVSSFFVQGSHLYDLLSQKLEVSNSHIRTAIVLYLNLLILESESDAGRLSVRLKASRLLEEMTSSEKGTMYALLWVLLASDGPMTAAERARVELVAKCVFIRKHVSQYTKILFDAAFMSFLVADRYGLEGVLTPERFEMRAWEDLQNSRIFDSGSLAAVT